MSAGSAPAWVRRGAGAHLNRLHRVHGARAGKVVPFLSYENPASDMLNIPALLVWSLHKIALFER
jgi:hypothetical protein